MLGLTCTSVACSRTADNLPLDDEADEGDATNEAELGDTSEQGSDTGEPPVACTSESDCSVGERCVGGTCTCMGCACEQPAPAPMPAWEPADPTPVSLDISEPECGTDADCGPLHYCDASECVATSACTEDVECRDQWGNRFCIEGLCRSIYCYYDEFEDSQCPAGSLCDDRTCTWIEVLPQCEQAPHFELVVAHVTSDPEASFVVLDLDSDGRDDIALLETGVVSRVMSTGTGFEAAATLPTEPGAQLVAIARADVHGDGSEELLISHAGRSGVEIFTTAGSLESAGFVATLHVPEQATTLDVDYDGLPDLVTGTDIDLLDHLQVQLGDGSGAFAPLWQADDVDPFVFGAPYAAYDEPDECRRTLTSYEGDFLGGRRFDYEEIHSGIWKLTKRPVTSHMVYAATPTRTQGHVATASLIDRGVLFHHNREGEVNQWIELPPEPSAVAFARLGQAATTNHALIDLGPTPASFIEFAGLDPSCRGELDGAFDAAKLEVGDFDGDDREDVLARGHDGILRVWFSRD